MNLVSHAKNFCPALSNILWAINSAILLVLAFPDFDFWYLAYVALIPLFYAIEQEKNSKRKSFVLGWIWGTTFFFGSCWWLTVPMIETGGLPTPIAYLLVLIVTAVAGLFPALFGLIQSVLFKRFGFWAVVYLPFVWITTEFLRYWLTGNNWNAIGYSQAFSIDTTYKFYGLNLASIGGIYLVAFELLVSNCLFSFIIVKLNGHYKSRNSKKFALGLLGLMIFTKAWLAFIIIFFTSNLRNVYRMKKRGRILVFQLCTPLLIYSALTLIVFIGQTYNPNYNPYNKSVTVIAIQPNVPTAGLTFETWKKLRQRHVELAENALQTTNDKGQKTIIIFPESPMNFEYAKDAEMRQFFKDFAIRNDAKVLFNTAEPVYPQYINREPYSMTPEQVGKSLETYNSMVMVDEKGEFESQYDKIYLLPFGEFIPLPKVLADYVPPVVGNFTFGKEYDILKFGDVNAGIMICFESHFPTLSNQHVRNGADVLVEVTNDGYLGNTAVLRQHLASAVFRAVETNRPVLRVTNVGITAYINERGEVIDQTQGFVEDTRIWTIAKSDGKQTIYVKYGDWFAWFCSFITLALLSICFWKKK